MAKGAVEIVDRRGNDGHLRVSWHPEKRVVNISQWRGGICVSSAPVELADVPSIVHLLVGALEEAARVPAGAQTVADPGASGSGRARRRRPLMRWARRRNRGGEQAQVIEMKGREAR